VYDSNELGIQAVIRRAVPRRQQ